MRSLLLLPLGLAAARLHSLPDDPHAFPKYNVAFLNNLPLQNETAQRWLADGLHGGVREFMNQPWDDHRRSLGDGGDDDLSLPVTVRAGRLSRGAAIKLGFNLAL